MLFIILGLMLIAYQLGTFTVLVKVQKEMGGTIRIHLPWFAVGPVLIILGVLL